jgi:hypothetical protein
MELTLFWISRSGAERTEAVCPRRSWHHSAPNFMQRDFESFGRLSNGCRNNMVSAIVKAESGISFVPRMLNLADGQLAGSLLNNQMKLSRRFPPELIQNRLINL